MGFSYIIHEVGNDLKVDGTTHSEEISKKAAVGTWTEKLVLY